MLSRALGMMPQLMQPKPAAPVPNMGVAAGQGAARAGMQQAAQPAGNTISGGGGLSGGNPSDYVGAGAAPSAGGAPLMHTMSSGKAGAPTGQAPPPPQNNGAPAPNQTPAPAGPPSYGDLMRSGFEKFQKETSPWTNNDAPMASGDGKSQGDSNVAWNTPAYGYASSPDRLRAKYGTLDPIGDFPNVRIPGVDLDRRDFDYNGLGQGAWNSRAADALNRAGPQLNAQALADAQQTRGMMLDAAMGRGPSVAQAQLQQGVDQSIAAQMAAANSARGGGVAQAAAQRAAMTGADQMRAQAAGQSAMLRAQEMQQARGQLLGADQQYGGLSMAQLQSDLGARGQNYGLGQAMYGYGMHAADADQAGRQAFGMGQANFDFNTQAGNANLAAGKEAKELQFAGNLINGGAGAVGGLLSLAALSDERAKTLVRGAGDEVDEMMAKLRPVSYEYKREAQSLPGASSGSQTGIMAQDLASSKAGSRLVSKGEDGYLRVDIGRAALAGLAAVARLHERVGKLEKK